MAQETWPPWSDKHEKEASSHDTRESNPDCYRKGLSMRSVCPDENPEHERKDDRVKDICSRVSLHRHLRANLTIRERPNSFIIISYSII